MLFFREFYLDDAYMYLIPFGFLGLHQFYVERPSWGVLYLLTGGMLGIGWLVDIVRLYWLVKKCNEEHNIGRGTTAPQGS